MRCIKEITVQLPVLQLSPGIAQPTPSRVTIQLLVVHLLRLTHRPAPSNSLVTENHVMSDAI